MAFKQEACNLSVMSVVTAFSECKGKNGKNYLSCSSEKICSSALGSEMDNSQPIFLDIKGLLYYVLIARRGKTPFFSVGMNYGA